MKEGVLYTFPSSESKRGTSFDIIFDYVKEDRNNKKPSCIIIFTDGEADYPDERKAMGIPVFWIINNNENTPPWGRVARLTLS